MHEFVVSACFHILLNVCTMSVYFVFTIYKSVTFISISLFLSIQEVFRLTYTDLVIQCHCPLYNGILQHTIPLYKCTTVYSSSFLTGGYFYFSFCFLAVDFTVREAQ